MEQAMDYSPSSVCSAIIDNFVMNRFLSATANHRNDNRTYDSNIINNNNNDDDDAISTLAEDSSSPAGLYNPAAARFQNGVNRTSAASIRRNCQGLTSAQISAVFSQSVSASTETSTKSPADQENRNRRSFSSETFFSDHSSDAGYDTTLTSSGNDAPTPEKSAPHAGNSTNKRKASASGLSSEGSNSASSAAGGQWSPKSGRNGKPSHSYIALISMAILSSPEKKMLLGNIYSYIMNTFPAHYNNQEKAWRNSIRHNLSLNECFVKTGRSDSGKGHYWTIHQNCIEDFARGDFRRRQARRRARKNSVTASTGSISDGLNDNYYTLGDYYGGDFFRGRMIDVGPNLGLGSVYGDKTDNVVESGNILGGERGFGSAFSHFLPNTNHGSAGGVPLSSDANSFPSLLLSHQPYCPLAQSGIRPPNTSSATSMFPSLPASQNFLYSHPTYRHNPIYPSTLGQMSYPWCLPKDDADFNPLAHVATGTANPLVHATTAGDFNPLAHGLKGINSSSSSSSPPSLLQRDSSLSDSSPSAGSPGSPPVSTPYRSSSAVSCTPRAVTKFMPVGLQSLQDPKSAVSTPVTMQALQDAATPPYGSPPSGLRPHPAHSSPGTPLSSPGIVDLTHNVSWLPSPTRTATAPQVTYSEPSRISSRLDNAFSIHLTRHQEFTVAAEGAGRW